ncbi:hypothetical protein Thiowin_02703 [Thiorhodovibrio winogradskyi]|uniref:Uncharacterized protein n=1 Tax=Thiorhodovibrio winogradskyi TaxID=77007 RepID=A0ABZ0SC88_9GAMM
MACATGPKWVATALMGNTRQPHAIAPDRRISAMARTTNRVVQPPDEPEKVLRG